MSLLKILLSLSYAVNIPPLYLPLPSTPYLFLPTLFSPLLLRKQWEGGILGLAGLQHFWAKAWCLIALLIHTNAARCVPPNTLAPHVQQNPAQHTCDVNYTLSLTNLQKPCTYMFPLTLVKVTLNHRWWLLSKNALFCDGNTISFHKHIVRCCYMIY